MTSAAPTDEDVLSSLDEPGALRIERRPYAYATSYPLEEVTVFLDDGRTLQLILKDLSWERLLADARKTKPRFLYEPRRCIETYRCVLPGSGVGARCLGAFTDEQSGRYWMLIDKVAGVELWQIGDFSAWESVARWLADFHRTFAEEGERVLERNPYLLTYGPDYLRIWPARALKTVGDELAGIVAGYDQVVERLAAVPQSFLHGERDPSNVLVAVTDHGVAVRPIDWEMAGVGPPLLDLAALTAGWDGDRQAQLVDAYLDELGPAPWLGAAGEVGSMLDACRLHYALQWLGWSGDWSPPPEHAQNWVSEALTLGEKLGL